MMVCFWTLPLYMLAIWMLLTNRRETDAIMFVYMGVWAGFALIWRGGAAPCVKAILCKACIDESSSEALCTLRLRLTQCGRGSGQGRRYAVAVNSLHNSLTRGG